MRWLAVGVWLIPLAAAMVASFHVWRRLGPNRLAVFPTKLAVRWLKRRQMVVAMLGWLPIAALAGALAPWYANVVMALAVVGLVARIAWAGLRETRPASPPISEGAPSELVDPPEPRS